GNTITQMVPGNPLNPGDPDIFAVEAPDTLRAFTKDGLQLWAVSPGVSSGSAPTQQQGTLALPSVTDAPGFAQLMPDITAAAQDDLRKRGAFDSLNLLLRQQRFIEQQRRTAGASPAVMTSALAGPLSSSLSLPSISAPNNNVTTLLIKTVPDNSGGTINLLE